MAIRLAGIAAVVLLLLPSVTWAEAQGVMLECRGQVNFTARIDPEAKTVTYLGNAGKSFELDQLDDRVIQWTEADEYGISTNALSRVSGQYMETFIHHRDRRRDVTRAMCQELPSSASPPSAP